MIRFPTHRSVAGALLLLALPTAAQGMSRTEIDRLVAVHAASHGMPEALVHRVIRRESGYNVHASSRGNYGLMQIRHGTAQGLGYRGSASGLLEAGTNLRYGIAYLAGAYRVAGGDHDRAVSLYARGYYYEAKRKGLMASGRARPQVGDPTPEPEPAQPAALEAELPSWLATLFRGQPTSPSGSEAEAGPASRTAEAEAEAAPGPEVKRSSRPGTTRVARQAPRRDRAVRVGTATAPAGVTR